MKMYVKLRPKCCQEGRFVSKKIHGTVNDSTACQTTGLQMIVSVNKRVLRKLKHASRHRGYMIVMKQYTIGKLFAPEYQTYT